MVFCLKWSKKIIKSERYGKMWERHEKNNNKNNGITRENDTNNNRIMMHFRNHGVIMTAK